MAASNFPTMGRLARAAWLDVLALLRALGFGILIAGVVLCTWAIAQEPEFFRRQDQQVAWTFIYALTDIWSFLCCLAAAPTRAGGLPLRLAHGLGSAMAAIAGTCLLVAIGIGVDLVVHLQTPWPVLTALALRYVMLWPALFLFAQVPLGERVILGRFVALLIVLAVQIAIHPLATSSAIVGDDKILASALAAAAGVVTMIGTNR